MSIATEPPIRMDLSCRTNDDKTVGAVWLASDAETPVPVASAVFTLEFEQPATEWVDGEPVPPPAAERHVIDGTNPTDPAGWIDGLLLAQGAVIVTIPHGIWANYEQRDGTWDLVASSTGGLRRTLVRGTFTTEQGVST